MLLIQRKAWTPCWGPHDTPWARPWPRGLTISRVRGMVSWATAASHTTRAAAFGELLFILLSPFHFSRQLSNLTKYPFNFFSQMTQKPWYNLTRPKNQIKENKNSRIDLIQYLSTIEIRIMIEKKNPKIKLYFATVLRTTRTDIRKIFVAESKEIVHSVKRSLSLRGTKCLQE